MCSSRAKEEVDRRATNERRCLNTKHQSNFHHTKQEGRTIFFDHDDGVLVLLSDPMIRKERQHGVAHTKTIMKLERRRRRRRRKRGGCPETLLLQLAAIAAVLLSVVFCPPFLLPVAVGWTWRTVRPYPPPSISINTKRRRTGDHPLTHFAGAAVVARTSLLRIAGSRGAETDEDDSKHSNLEDDIGKRLSISKERSSSPSVPASNRSYRSSGTPRRSRFAPRDGTGKVGSTNNKSAKGTFPSSVRGSDGTHKKLHHSRGSAELDRSNRSQHKEALPPRRRKPVESNSKSSTPYFPSLLPPPLSTMDPIDAKDDPLSTGLSSWEEFLGVGSNLPGNGRRDNNHSQSSSRQQTRKPHHLDRSRQAAELYPERLPSIQDLFPPDLTSQSARPARSRDDASPKPIVQPSSLDGVLPVSDLFYRSSQLAEDGEELVDDDDDDNEHDDEELPFSAEQSDALTSDNNKLHVRRNLAKPHKLATKQEMAKTTTAQGSPPKKRNGRKMVRRGMEMLVGGVPINADPPQRSVELCYDGSVSADNWASAITLNTMDFGPLLHASSIPFVTEMERGLFCEHFCQAARKWDVLPKDLLDMVRSFSRSPTDSTAFALVNNPEYIAGSDSTHTEGVPSEGSLPTRQEEDDEEEEDDDADDLSIPVLVRPLPVLSESKDDRDAPRRSALSRARGFGKSTKKVDIAESKMRFEGKCELVFELPISKDELESGDNQENGAVLKSVLAAAFQAVVADEFKSFTVYVSKLLLIEQGDGTTRIDVELAISNDRPMHREQVHRRMKRISAAFLQAVDDGVMQVAIATSARAEARWPPELRERVAEECLFDDDVIDDVTEDSSASILGGAGPNVSLISKNREDLFAAAGNDGVYPDYSASSRFNAPYGGELGLRLVDAVVQRSKERLPRVIAVGDVHGCIDELQDLLRQCDYRPGDLVVFLVSRTLLLPATTDGRRSHLTPFLV